jgi:hypothetical protein
MVRTLSADFHDFQIHENLFDFFVLDFYDKNSDTFKNRKSLLKDMKFTKRHEKNPKDFLVSLGELLRLSKRGQLGIIEFKFLMIGLLLGIIIALALVWLGTAGILPFKIPLVCG